MRKVQYVVLILVVHLYDSLQEICGNGVQHWRALCIWQEDTSSSQVHK